ncbi:hypothetical protein AGMMS49525_11820 [Bacteroidia bacterium]|nr:hypothetical protein AGMMS49525_11820 [Bacteroidia bacterium]
MKRMLFIIGLFGLVSCASGMDEFQAKKEASVEADSIPNISDVAEDTVPHAYIPMLIPGNQWIERIDGNPMSPYPSTHINIIELGNDTIIEGVKYTQFIEYHNRVLPSLGNTYVYISHIREDTTSQKVFYLDGYGEEELLYDFQLQVGDIIGEEYFEHSVETIDFINIGGISRKRMILHPIHEDYHDTDVVWIEGIGCLEYGLISGSRGPVVGSRTTLTSFSQNGVQVYPESSTGIPQISLSRRQ